jgi:hypothetical protein
MTDTGLTRLKKTSSVHIVAAVRDTRKQVRGPIVDWC